MSNPVKSSLPSESSSGKIPALTRSSTPGKYSVESADTAEPGANGDKAAVHSSAAGAAGMSANPPYRRNGPAGSGIDSQNGSKPVTGIEDTKRINDSNSSHSAQLDANAAASSHSLNDLSSNSNQNNSVGQSADYKITSPSSLKDSESKSSKSNVSSVPKKSSQTKLEPSAAMAKGGSQSSMKLLPNSSKSSLHSRGSRSCTPEGTSPQHVAGTATFRLSSGSSDEDVSSENRKPKSCSSRFHVAKVSKNVDGNGSSESSQPLKSSLSKPKDRESSGHSRGSKKVGLVDSDDKPETNRSDSITGGYSSSPPPLSELAGSAMYTSYDTTTAQKTFGRNTLEKLPHEDHYRNLLSTTAALRQRPTLLELHELDLAETKEQELFVEEQRHLCAVTVEEVKPTPAGKKFGWIEGVLVRCILNIFGVMLFLRMSWVVGQAGLGLVTCIIMLASTVTVLTALSMSAICTNGQVKGGGAYYMISRSLGPEFGGAIGVVFSLANAVAASMYIVGFAETIRDILVDHARLMIDEINDVRIIGLTTACVLIVITLGGLTWEAKAQLVLLAILVIAILNFMIGTFIPPSANQKSQGFVGYSATAARQNMGPDFRGGHSFFSVFAIFFPAATGILAGANISGDLKDAQKAIPLGTLLAILITTTTYVVIAWMSGVCVLRDAAGPAAVLLEEGLLANLANYTTEFYTEATTMGVVMEEPAVDVMLSFENRTLECVSQQNCEYGLHNDMQVMQMVSAFGPITIAGIISATLSSALASLVSAPKIFQAVAKDKIFPYIHVFAVGYGKGDEPRRAYVLAFILCVACIAIGDLNAIAPLISNFFLMSYALINYSCFDASLAKSPGWRPAFKYYSMWLSLLGAVLCVGVMFVISWWTALVTMALVFMLFFYVHYRKPDINWGSSTQAHVYRSALQHTHKLIQVTEHVKNFRPQLLVLTGLPRDRPALVDFCASLTKNISLMVCGHVVVGDPTARLLDARIGAKTAQIWLSKRKTKSFYSLVTADSLRVGVQSLLQAVGLGKLKPNILMMGFKSDWLEVDPNTVIDYVNIIHDAFDQNYGVGILRLEEGFCRNSPNLEERGGLMDRVSSVQADMSSSNATTRQSTPLKHGNASDKIHINVEEEDDDEDDDDEYDVKHKSQKKGMNGGSNTKGGASNSNFLTVDGGGDREATPLKESSSFAHQRYLDSEMESRFRRKQGKGFVDVWWLFDDGGLTLLVPYILTTKKLWGNCKLRVFVAASKKSALDRDQRQMASMLNKFRIEYSSMTVVTDMEARPKPERKSEVKPDHLIKSRNLTLNDIYCMWRDICLSKFNELIVDWVKPHDYDDDGEESAEENKEPWKFTKQELQAQRAKTMRHIRLRELLEQHSSDASLIVMTLPMPRKGFCPAGLYMAWIDTLTRDMPPLLLLRGNQENVLTYYS